MESSAGVSTLVIIQDDFRANRQSSRGLISDGETWLRESLEKFLRWLAIPLADVTSSSSPNAMPSLDVSIISALR